MKMMTFEERLHNHWIYCNNLYNLIIDLQYELEERGSNTEIIPYKKGKYATLRILNIDDREYIDEQLEYIISNQQYFSDLRYYIEEDMILFWIEI